MKKTLCPMVSIRILCMVEKWVVKGGGDGDILKIKREEIRGGRRRGKENHKRNVLGRI